MDNTEKRIWQYLDGELSSSQSKSVEQRLTSDPLFKAQFDKSQQLHSGLRKLPVESAPSDMMQQIMKGVSKEKIYIAKQTSFIDLKYILGIFGGLNLLLLAYLILGDSEVRSGFSFSEYLAKYTGVLQNFQFSQPDVTSNLIPYGLTLGFMLVLFWADQLASNLRPSKRRI